MISSIEMPAFARAFIAASAPEMSSSMLCRSRPWSRKASIVAGGIVLIVSAPISSST